MTTLSEQVSSAVTTLDAAANKAESIVETDSVVMTEAGARNSLPKVIRESEEKHDAQIAAHETEFKQRMAQMEFVRVGTFTAGYSALTDMRQTLLAANGHEYGWSGTFPKTVAAESTPESTGGVGAGAWVDRSDATLHGELNVIVKRFNCVADMVADTTLTIGKQVSTIGYYNGWAATVDGPIGGNDYEIVSSSLGTVDGGSFIALANGLRAKGLFLHYMPSDAQFGAKIDGITDDFLAVKNAIAFSKKVRLVKGNRAIGSPIPFISQSIYGEGSQGGSIVTAIGKFSAFKYAGAYANGGKLKGFQIDFGSTTPVLADASIGIDYGSSSDTTWPARYAVEDVYIRGATRAIQDDTGAWSGSYKKVWAQNCRLAFSKRAGTMTLFEQCYSEKCLQAWVCVNAYTVTLLNCAADSWNTINGAIIDFNNCPSFKISGLQCEAGVVSDNGIVIRAYRGSCGDIDCVNFYGTNINISTGNVGYLIYTNGSQTNVSVSGLVVKNTIGVPGYTGTLRLTSATSSSRMTVKSGYLGGVTGGYGIIISAYADAGSTVIFDEAVMTETGFTSGSDIRRGSLYVRNGLKTLSSVVVAAGGTVKYEVPIAGLFNADLVVATPTFASQGEVITARYYNGNYASIIIENPTALSLTLSGNIYVQVIRHFSSDI